MPDPSLQAYLAAKYLSGPKADAILARTGTDKKKRRKRKHDDGTTTEASSSASGLRLLDDDDERKEAGLREDEEEQDALEAQVVQGPKTAKFKPIGLTKLNVDEQLAAEEEDDDDPESQPQIAQGAELKAQHQRALKASSSLSASSSTPGPSAPPDDVQFETVYRDRSGRKIDVRAEEQARKEAEAAKRKKDEERKTWGQGIKQKDDQRAARQRLREEASTSFARHADDKRMNDTLRSIERSDDPALAFLTQKRSSHTGPPKPKYKGPSPAPNRFGIAPGYRWDGVDRSTGFEKMYFQKLNERKRRNASALAYDQDDL